MITISENKNQPDSENLNTRDLIGREVRKKLPDGSICNFTLGDISGDQDVDQDDLEILQHIVNNTSLGQFVMDKMGVQELMACDIDGNGIVDQKDFILLCNYIISKMEELARTDELTELDNRRALKEKTNMKMMASKQFRVPLSCLFIDLDYFKQLNDTYGHDVGDKVLCYIAGALKKNTRTSDIVARYGGEEFVVILDNAPLKASIMVGEKIMKYLKTHPLELGDTKISITISIGVSQYEDHMSFQRFIKQSDLALYKAKESGRNRICTFSLEGEKIKTDAER